MNESASARGRKSAMEVQCMGIISSTKPFLKLRHGSLPGYYSKSNACPPTKGQGQFLTELRKWELAGLASPKASLPSLWLLTSWDCLQEKYYFLLLLFWLSCSPCKGHHLWLSHHGHQNRGNSCCTEHAQTSGDTMISLTNCQPHICTDALKNQ